MNDEELDKTFIDDWDVNYEKWDKAEFAESLGSYLSEYVPESHEFDQHLIAMLATEMDIYVCCYLEIQKNGLVIVDSRGNLIGQSPCVRIMHRRLENIRRLRKELKLLLKDRVVKNND